MKHVLMVALAALALGASGCTFGGGDNTTEDANDAPKCKTADERNCADVTANDTASFNNTMPNVGYKCTKLGTAVYVTTDRVVIVQPNPNCPGYIDGKMPNVVTEGR